MGFVPEGAAHFISITFGERHGTLSRKSWLLPQVSFTDLHVQALVKQLLSSHTGGEKREVKEAVCFLAAAETVQPVPQGQEEKPQFALQ